MPKFKALLFENVYPKIKTLADYTEQGLYNPILDNG